MLRRNILKSLAIGLAGVLTGSAAKAKSEIAEKPEIATSENVAQIATSENVAQIETLREIKDGIDEIYKEAPVIRVNRSCRFTLDGEFNGIEFPSIFVQSVNVDYGRREISFNILDVAGTNSPVHLVNHLTQSMKGDKLTLTNYDFEGNVTNTQTFSDFCSFSAASSYSYNFGTVQDSLFVFTIAYGTLSVS